MTKGPRRAELSGDGINTFTGSTTPAEEIESREYHGNNKPRMPLVKFAFYSQEINRRFFYYIF